MKHKEETVSRADYIPKDFGQKISRMNQLGWSYQTHACLDITGHYADTTQTRFTEYTCVTKRQKS